MKFIVSSSQLLKQLQAISGVLNTSNPLPILDNFLFDIYKSELVVSASDLETTMTTRISIEAKKAGRIAVPARILLDTLKTFPEQPLTFSVDESTFAIEIVSDNGKYKLAGHNAEDYPHIPEVAGAKSLELPGAVLLSAINKTIFATGNDELRPVMCGVFCQIGKEALTFVATDAHKLARYRRKDIAGPAEAAFILPKKPLNLLKNVLGAEDTRVKINYNDSNAFFEAGQISLICRLIDGRYPNYEAVIPSDNPNKLVIDRMAFLNSIKRISIFSNKTTYQIRLKIAGSELEVSAEDLDFSNAANERHTCQYKGSDMEIGFNARFLMDMLSNIDTAEVLLEMSAPNRAGVLFPYGSPDSAKTEDLLMLVMPVMLNA